jgi:putative acetyltransferase
VVGLNSKAQFDLVTVAAAGPDADAIRDLFLEYGESLGFNTCFGGFEQELLSLPGDYAPPRGALLLAKEGEERAGCVALKPLSAGACEMKRLYVRPQFRRSGLGRRLAEAVIAQARAAGYRQINLDTLPTMIEARGLYAALGFRSCAPYYDNACVGSDCFELDLCAP